MQRKKKSNKKMLHEIDVSLLTEQMLAKLSSLNRNSGDTPIELPEDLREELNKIISVRNTQCSESFGPPAPAHNDSHANSHLDAMLEHFKGFLPPFPGQTPMPEIPGNDHKDAHADSHTDCYAT